MKKTAIIISDYRVTLLIAALQLRNQFEVESIFTHEAFCYSPDYGNNAPVFYNRFKLEVLKKLSDIRVIKAFSSQPLRSFAGVMSSLVSATMDCEASEMKYPQLYKRYIDLAKASSAIAEALVAENYQRVILFNGRLASVFEAKLQFEENGIETLFYEYGMIPFHFTLSKSNLHDMLKHAEDAIALHQRKNLQPSLFRFSGSANILVKNKLKSMFSQLYKEKPTNTYEFTLFLGSPHEFVFTEGYTVLSNEKYVNELWNRRGVGKGCVRAHPNQLRDPSWEGESSRIRNLCDTFGYDYYGPESEVDSHELILRSKEVIVGGSSIAMDAYFLRTKVEFIGESPYKTIIEYANSTASGLEATHIAAEVLEAMKYVRQVPFHPKNTILLKVIFYLDDFISRPPVFDRLPNREVNAER